MDTFFPLKRWPSKSPSLPGSRVGKDIARIGGLKIPTTPDGSAVGVREVRSHEDQAGKLECNRAVHAPMKYEEEGREEEEGRGPSWSPLEKEKEITECGNARPDLMKHGFLKVTKKSVAWGASQ